MTSAGPRILAVLVTHDGAPRLRRTVTAVAAQTQPGIELLAVDNASTDGTGALLVELLGPDRVILSDRDLGLPAGIDLALDAVDAEDARRGRPGPGESDLVLILHDDLELERDAVERLVAALEADEHLAIVGPKLRWADDPTRLQSVGATIDLTGRVDDGIDPGELDQGQRDGDRRVLFVPTAGMLVRRRVLEELGRFDPRAHAFREDLDLCWRAAIAGYDVEVVPEAVGRHAALGAEHRRSGRVAELGPRFLAERNTLAAILTNYGAVRLLAVVPLALAVGLAKVAGFLLTRRIADARATVAAWGWNLANLPGTLGRRRAVQRTRRRSDAEIAPLFGRVTPRLRAYLEAVLDRLAGEAAPGELGSAETQPSATLQGELAPGVRTAQESDLASAASAGRLDREPPDDAAADVEADPPADPPAEDGGVGGLRGALRRSLDRVRAQPLQVLVPPTVLLLAIGLRDVLLPGPVRGGDLQPFPAGPGMIARHLAAWHDSGSGPSALDPSPAQLVLGALQAVAGGGALRVLMLLAPIVAWAATMRVLRSHVDSLLARTVLALAFAASAPVLTALAAGDLVTLVVAVVIPLLVLAATPVLDASAPVERVWRRLAATTFLVAVLIAFAPPFVLVLPVVVAAGVGHALVAVQDLRWRRTLIVRSVLLALLPLPLLGPWSLSLPAVLREQWTTVGTSLGGHPATWSLLDPTGRLLGAAGAALLLAGLAGALTVAVADVGPTTFRTGIAMTVLGLGTPLLAWWIDAAATTVRTGPLLLVAAAALVGLAGVGLAHLPAVLSAHPFGWRQIGVALIAGATIMATGAGVIGLAIGGTPGMTREDVVPAYLATLAPHPPDRVLVIGARSDGIAWEVVPATGPDLAAFGVRHDPVLRAQVAAAVDDLLSGSDPRAAARLGRLGIGVVLVPEGLEDPALDRVLRAQSALDPLPTLTGSVARIAGAVPGAAIVRGDTAAGGVPDPTLPPRSIVATLERDAPGALRGATGPGGDLLAALPFGAGWSVRVDGDALPLRSDDGLLQVRDIPPDATVELVAAMPPTRAALLRAQAVWALLILSLGARPPALALRNARRRAEQSA